MRRTTVEVKYHAGPDEADPVPAIEEAAGGVYNFSSYDGAGGFHLMFAYPDRDRAENAAARLRSYFPGARVEIVDDPDARPIPDDLKERIARAAETLALWPTGPLESAYQFLREHGRFADADAVWKARASIAGARAILAETKPSNA